MSVINHADRHNDEAAEIVALATFVGANPHIAHGETYANLEDRLDWETIAHVLSTDKPNSTLWIGRRIYETDTGRTRQSSEGGGWELREDPNIFRLVDTGRVGINKLSPELTLHVREAGSTAEPAVGSAEVARFVRTGTSGALCTVSLVGGSAGGARLIMGTSESLSESGLDFDAASSELGLLTNGTKKIAIRGDGGTVIRRDGTGSMPDLGGATVLGLVRNGDPGHHANVVIASGATGASSILFGTVASPQRGMIRYHQDTDMMAIWTDGAEAIQIHSNSRTLIRRDGLGSIPTWETDETLRVQRNTDTSSNVSMGLVSGASGNSRIRFGATSGTGSRGLISYSAATDSFIFQTAGSTAMEIFGTGKTEVSASAGGGSSPAFSPASAFRVRRNADAGNSCNIEIMGGSTGTASILFAHATVLDHGRIDMIHTSDVMRAQIDSVSGWTLTKHATLAPEVRMQGVWDHTEAGSANVIVNSGGWVRRATSALKYKTVIAPVEVADCWGLIAAGQGAVTYQHQADPPGHHRMGLIADDIAAAYPLAGEYNGIEVENYDFRSVLAATVTALRDVKARLEMLEGTA